MNNIVGVLADSEHPAKAIKYVMNVQIDLETKGDILRFTEDRDKALKFISVEDAKKVITSSAVVFRTLDIN